MKNPKSERKTIELITDGTAADKIVAMLVEQLGDFSSNMEVVPYSCTWEQVPSINVITGGTLNSNIGGRPPLAFYDSELPGGAANSAIPLLVRASMANVTPYFFVIYLFYRV